MKITGDDESPADAKLGIGPGTGAAVDPTKTMEEAVDDGNLFGGDTDTTSDSSDSVHVGILDVSPPDAVAVATMTTVDHPDADKGGGGGGPQPPALVQELTKSSVSAEDGKEGKEDGNGNKEGSASAQAPTAQAGTAVLAAVPRKGLPVNEEAEAEARQKAKHTGYIVRQHVCRAELCSDVWCTE